jgi:hypothetical protein
VARPELNACVEHSPGLTSDDMTNIRDYKELSPDVSTNPDAAQ